MYIPLIGLVLGGVSVLLRFSLPGTKETRQFLCPEVVFLLVFAVWQAFRTIPYLLSFDSMDVVRDAAVWGYATYALFIYWLVPREAVERFFHLYGRLLPYYLAWVVTIFILGRSPLPIGSTSAQEGSLIWLGAGDVANHLAGAAAFMLLRLDLYKKGWSSVTLWLLWLLWVIVWIAPVSATSRAGMLSALLGIGVVVLWKPKTRWYRPFLLVAIMVALLMATGYKQSISIYKPWGALSEELSYERTVDRISSIVEDRGGRLEETKKWRFGWWGKIVDYTFGGKYFWLGKGYGINLAFEDGFFEWYRLYTNMPPPNRNPHNIFMTILARSGVPGLILWSLFLVVFAGMLVRVARLAKQESESPEGLYAVWVMAYCSAFLFEATFGVSLESHMGGIWFWSLVGMSLAYFKKEKSVTPDWS
jgi:hypothetical protein